MDNIDARLKEIGLVNDDDAYLDKKKKEEKWKHKRLNSGKNNEEVVKV